MACGIRKKVCITTTEVNEFDIIVDAGEQDIVGLQIKMEHLMAVKIANDIQQLTDKLIRVLPFREIIGLSNEALRKGLALDILHQDTVTVE